MFFSKPVFFLVFEPRFLKRSAFSLYIIYIVRFFLVVPENFNSVCEGATSLPHPLPFHFSPFNFHFPASQEHSSPR